MRKKTYQDELFLLLKNSTTRKYNNWESYFENFEEDNLEFCKKYPKDLDKFRDRDQDDEGWKHHIRMIKVWKEAGITEMNADLDFLFSKHSFPIKKFKINSISGNYFYPNKITMVTKILRTGNDLIQNVFPEILNNLNSTHAITSSETQSYSGNIDWANTIRYNVSKGMVVPTTFVTTSHQKIFETPENKLAILSMIILKKDILKLLVDSDLKKKIEDSSMHSQLNELNFYAENLLNDPRIQSIYKNIEKYESIAMEKTNFKNLQILVQQRIDNREIKHNSLKSYESLLKWIKSYSQQNIHSILGDKEGVTVQIDESNVDIIYEWWIIFSLIDVLQKNKIKIEKPNLDTKGDLQGFTLSHKKIEFELKYEHEFSNLAEEFGKPKTIRPDFILTSLDQKFVPVVLDAKNYLADGTLKAAKNTLLDYRRTLRDNGMNTMSTIGFLPKIKNSWEGSGPKSVLVKASSLNKVEFEMNLDRLYSEIFSKAIDKLIEYENSKND
jgi:hypothetical protein